VISLSHLPIVEWDDEEKTAGAIVRVPYIDIEDIVRDLEKEEVKHPLLSPYKENDPAFNARAASVLQSRLPEWDILMPIATSSRIQTGQFIKAAIDAGQNKFAVPLKYGYYKQYLITQLLHFLPSNILGSSTWFHVAGGEPELPDHWPGIWTWSEEEL